MGRKAGDRKGARPGRGEAGGAGVAGGEGSTGGAIWGYVEGYYGRIFGWKERARLLDHLAALGANAYLYAPKEDAFHRRDWRKPYPAAWRREFGALALRSRRRGVDLVPGMAPGLSYDYLAPADYRILLAKLKAFRDLGCRTLALLMDDIPPALPENCRSVFRSLGEAHGLLLRRLLADLGRGRGGVRLWFCPTVYTDQFASGPLDQDPYLVDLAATMPPEIPLMWTGPRIISERLGRGEIGTLARKFPGGILLWDNLYANDYCPGKIFLGPYRGRTAETWRMTRGILLNPTGLPATDRLLLDLLADSRRGVPAAESWEAALERHAVPGEFREVARFLDSPFYAAGGADLSPRRMEAARKALKTLIWDWKGELHQEWYPYLFMLDADLKLASGTLRKAPGKASRREKDAPDEAWVRKRYSPLLARLLLRR